MNGVKDEGWKTTSQMKRNVKREVEGRRLRRGQVCPLLLHLCCPYTDGQRTAEGVKYMHHTSTRGRIVHTRDTAETKPPKKVQGHGKKDRK